eukprot:364111-Chlamydomonas_euryale.AAC.14
MGTRPGRVPYVSWRVLALFRLILREVIRNGQDMPDSPGRAQDEGRLSECMCSTRVQPGGALIG